MPNLYDLVQGLAGIARSRRRLAPLLGELGDKRVLDVGAGTGAYTDLVPACADYTAVDVDPRKLERFRERWPGREAREGDATALPFPNGSFDVALFFAVAHHLDDDALARAVDECARVITERVLVLDPIVAPDVLRARLLWRLDRGSHPRTAAEIEAAFARRFRIAAASEYAVHHRYVLLDARAT